MKLFSFLKRTLRCLQCNKRNRNKRKRTFKRKRKGG